MSFSRNGAVLNNTSNIEYKNAIIKHEREKERIQKDKKIDMFFSIVQELKIEVHLLKQKIKELEEKMEKNK